MRRQRTWLAIVLIAGLTGAPAAWSVPPPDRAGTIDRIDAPGSEPFAPPSRVERSTGSPRAAALGRHETGAKGAFGQAVLPAAVVLGGSSSPARGPRSAASRVRQEPRPATPRGPPPTPFS